MATRAHARNHAFFDLTVTNLISADTRLSTKAKCLGFVLASLGDGSPCYAPAAKLSVMCGLTVNSVIAARHELERFGYVVTEKRSGRIHRYVLHCPAKSEVMA